MRRDQSLVTGVLHAVEAHHELHRVARDEITLGRLNNQYRNQIMPMCAGLGAGCLANMVRTVEAALHELTDRNWINPEPSTFAGLEEALAHLSFVEEERARIAEEAA